MTTPNKNLAQPSYNSTSPTWDVPLNGNATALDLALGGVQSINLASYAGGTITLVGTYAGSYPSNSASYVPMIMNLIGLPTGSATLQIPSGVGGQWVVSNNLTAGAYSDVTISNASGGASVVVQQGQTRSVVSTGSTIIFADSQTFVSPIPAGTTMLFYQASAPTGWTQNTSYNDCALRVVSGTGGGAGGSVSFSSAFSSQAVTGSVGNTSLSVDQLPAHTHGTGISVFNYAPGNPGNYFDFIRPSAIAGTTGSTGSGNPHGHTFSGGTINLNVNYVNVIICSKN